MEVDFIDLARTSIDMAACVLTDWAVIQALTRAADRGVAIKTKLSGEPLMHCKSYQVDGRLLRTGSENFSPSGLKRQDNDLVVINSAEAAEAFRRNFDRVFADGEAVE